MDGANSSHIPKIGKKIGCRNDKASSGYSVFNSLWMSEVILLNLEPFVLLKWLQLTFVERLTSLGPGLSALHWLLLRVNWSSCQDSVSLMPFKVFFFHNPHHHPPCVYLSSICSLSLNVRSWWVESLPCSLLYP